MLDQPILFKNMHILYWYGSKSGTNKKYQAALQGHDILTELRILNIICPINPHPRYMNIHYATRYEALQQTL